MNGSNHVRWIVCHKEANILSMSTSSNLLALNAKVVFDLAAQVNPPEKVAEEHGLDPQYLLEVLEMPQVKKLVADKRRELDEAGFALQVKAKLMFEDMLPDIYRKAKDRDMSLSSLLDAAKFLRQVAGLDKQEVSQQQQEKFSININFSGSRPQPVTIDTQTNTIAIGDLPDTTPAYIKPIAGANDLYYEADQ